MNATTATTKNEVLRKGGEEENLVVVFGGNDEGVEGWRVDGHERPQSLKDVSHLFASSPLLPSPFLSSLLCNPSKIEGPKRAITADISQRRHHTVGSTLYIYIYILLGGRFYETIILKLSKLTFFNSFKYKYNIVLFD